MPKTKSMLRSGKRLQTSAVLICGVFFVAVRSMQSSGPWEETSATELLAN